MFDSDLLTPADTSSIFDGMEIRKDWHQNQRYFSITDTIKALVWDARPKQYRTDLKTQLKREGNELYGKIVQLKITASDGKRYLTDTCNTETLLRIIQSIPSPKAEPFKQWLASLWNANIEEFNDPELWIHRAKVRAIQAYRAKGFPDKDIQSRMQGIEVRRDFTKELHDRWIEWKWYGILTNIASYWWAGKNASEYKNFKWLSPTDNLRDHMTRPEHLLTALAEETTTQIVKNKDLKGFDKIQSAAFEWAKVAQKAKEEFEKTTGGKVVSDNNRLTERQKKLREKKTIKDKGKF